MGLGWQPPPRSVTPLHHLTGRHPALPTQQGAPRALAPPPGSCCPCTSWAWFLQCLALSERGRKGRSKAEESISEKLLPSWPPTGSLSPGSRKCWFWGQRHGPSRLCLPTVPSAGWAPGVRRGEGVLGLQKSWYRIIGHFTHRLLWIVCPEKILRGFFYMPGTFPSLLDPVINKIKIPALMGLNINAHMKHVNYTAH